MGSTGTVDAILAEWHPVQARLDALDVAMWERATATARAAGLDQGRNVWHNALIDRARPWSGVDYALLRRAAWIDARRDEVRRLRDRLWALLYRRHFPAPTA